MNVLTPLAYHADAEITRWLLVVAVPLALLALVASAYVLTRGGPARGDNSAAVWALPLGIAASVIALLAPLALIVLPFALIPIAALVVAAVAAIRVPRQGRRKRVAVAVALSGLSFAYLAGETAACVVTDACFH